MTLEGNGQGIVVDFAAAVGVVVESISALLKSQKATPGSE